MAHLVDQQPKPEYAGPDPDGNPYWYVQSSGKGPFFIEYTVRLSDEAGYSCDCRAFGSCWHIGAVKQAVKAIMA